MSERLEQWKAREKLRSDIGWAAVLIGLWGLLPIAAGIAEVVGIGAIRALPISLAVGTAFLFCALGLWNASVWARWACAALFATLSVLGLVTLVRNRTWGLELPSVLFATIYLLLPSTGRRFARARDTRSRAVDPEAGSPP
jgi:hypothetical protein